jgi:hypothetical protein
MTSPNFFVTSPKKVGRSPKKNILLPIKLGEVKKQTYFSQKSWEKYVKKIVVHFLSLGKK